MNTECCSSILGLAGCHVNTRLPPVFAPGSCSDASALSSLGAGLEEYIHRELGLEPEYPARVMAASNEIWAPAFRAYGLEPELPVE
jgi:hypothetical protein